MRLTRLVRVLLTGCVVSTGVRSAAAQPAAQPAARPGAHPGVHPAPDAPPAPRRPQEVLQGDLVYPQERHELQLTASTSLRAGAGRFTVPLLAEYGLSDRWQLEGSVEIAGPARHSAPGQRMTAGLQGMSLGLRRSWLAIGGTRTHVAAGVELESERGRDGRELSLGPEVALALDLGRSRRAQLFAHGSVAVGADGVRPATTLGALVPAGKVIVLLEASRATADGDGPDDEAEAGGEGRDEEGGASRVTPGVVVPVAGGFELAVGAPLRLTAGRRRLGVVLKLTREF